jgi:hypothetical protein
VVARRDDASSASRSSLISETLLEHCFRGTPFDMGPFSRVGRCYLALDPLPPRGPQVVKNKDLCVHAETLRLLYP